MFFSYMQSLGDFCCVEIGPGQVKERMNDLASGLNRRRLQAYGTGIILVELFEFVMLFIVALQTQF